MTNGLLKKKKTRKIAGSILRYAILIFLALFVVVPVLWMLSTAFKTEAETYSPNPVWIPTEISFDSFKKFWGIYNFGTMTKNSLVTCIGSMIICTACSCFADMELRGFILRGKRPSWDFFW